MSSDAPPSVKIFIITQKNICIKNTNDEFVELICKRGIEVAFYHCFNSF
jgi:hypothetical protein